MSNVVFPQIETEVSFVFFHFVFKRNENSILQEEKMKRYARAVLNRVMIARLGQVKSIVSHADVMMALANAREERKAEFDRICPSQKVRGID